MKRRDFLIAGGAGTSSPSRARSRARRPHPRKERADAPPRPGRSDRRLQRQRAEGHGESDGVLKSGGSALDAVVAGVNRVEEDSDDITVRLRRLPNERGVVELDASRDARPLGRGRGGCAAEHQVPVEGGPLVMEQTITSSSPARALEFARAQGFPEENLLTEKSRRSGSGGARPSRQGRWIAPPESEWPPE